MYHDSLFGDPVELRMQEAEQRKAVPWLTANASEYWADDAGYVFQIYDYKTLVLKLTPDGRYQDKRFVLGDGKAGNIVNTLQSKGRKLDPFETYARVSAAKAAAAKVAASTIPVAAATAMLAPPPALPALPATTTGGAKPRRRKSTPIHKQTWFPFAVAGGALVLFGGIFLLARRK